MRHELQSDELQVVAFHPLYGVPQKLLRIAAALENQHDNTIARAVVRFAQQQNIVFPLVESTCNAEITRGTVDERIYTIGAASFFIARALMSGRAERYIEALQRKNCAVALLGDDERVLAVFGFSAAPCAAPGD